MYNIYIIYIHIYMSPTLLPYGKFLDFWVTVELTLLDRC